MKATVNFSCGTSLESGNYTPPYIKPEIIGAELVCGTATYTMQNASAASVTWSSNNTSIVTINTSGMASKVSNGQASIKATFPCNAPSVQKTIWVGLPAISASDIIWAGTMICPNTEQYAYVNNTNGTQHVSGYTWTVSGGTILSGQGTPSLEFRTANNINYIVNVGANPVNACGTGSFKYVSKHTSSCGGPLRVYPNPSRGAIQISDVNTPDVSPTTSADEFSVTLSDKDGKIITAQKSTKRSFNYLTTGLAKGTYYIKIQDGENVTTERVIIE